MNNEINKNRYAFSVFQEWASSLLKDKNSTGLCVVSALHEVYNTLELKFKIL